MIAVRLGFLLFLLSLPFPLYAGFSCEQLGIQCPSPLRCEPGQPRADGLKVFHSCQSDTVKGCPLLYRQKPSFVKNRYGLGYRCTRRKGFSKPECLPGYRVEVSASAMDSGGYSCLPQREVCASRGESLPLEGGNGYMCVERRKKVIR